MLKLLLSRVFDALALCEISPLGPWSCSMLIFPFSIWTSGTAHLCRAYPPLTTSGFCKRSFSILAPNAYDNKGNPYNVTKILNQNGTFDLEAFHAYSPLSLPYVLMIICYVFHIGIDTDDYGNSGQHLPCHTVYPSCRSLVGEVISLLVPNLIISISSYYHTWCARFQLFSPIKLTASHPSYHTFLETYTAPIQPFSARTTWYPCPANVAIPSRLVIAPVMM